MEIIRCAIGLLAGSAIGLGFGTVQEIAQRRNQKLQESGKLNSGWAVMPGSMRRVAYFMVALVLVQLLCPLLFVGSSQWWVTGGVVLGYGGFLASRLKKK